MKLASSFLMLLASSIKMASTQELQEEGRYLRGRQAPDDSTGRILAPPSGEGTMKNIETLTLSPSSECTTIYNADICQKFVDIRNDLAKGKPFNMNAFKLLKQQMKDIRKTDPKRKEFKDVVTKVLDRNKNKPGKVGKELALEVINELQSLDLKQKLTSDIAYGYSVPDEMATIDPYAGQDDSPLSLAGYNVTVSEYEEGGNRRLGVPATSRRWTNGIVKYSVVFETDYSGYWRWVERVLPAMNEIEDLTEITFELQTYYWTFDSAPSNGQVYITAVPNLVCNAHVGAPPSNVKHRVSLGPTCLRGTILHELLHVIGMQHQQNAFYRDKYVTVYYQNIQTAYSSAFDKLPSTHGFEFVYDYGSIMHYGELAFSSNNLKTIDCRGYRCGQLDGLSYWDVLEVYYFNRGYYVFNTQL